MVNLGHPIVCQQKCGTLKGDVYSMTHNYGRILKSVQKCIEKKNVKAQNKPWTWKNSIFLASWLTHTPIIDDISEEDDIIDDDWMCI